MFPIKHETELSLVFSFSVKEFSSLSTVNVLLCLSLDTKTHQLEFHFGGCGGR